MKTLALAILLLALALPAARAQQTTTTIQLSRLNPDGTEQPLGPIRFLDPGPAQGVDFYLRSTPAGAAGIYLLRVDHQGFQSRSRALAATQVMVLPSPSVTARQRVAWTFENQATTLSFTVDVPWAGAMEIAWDDYATSHPLLAAYSLERAVQDTDQWTPIATLGREWTATADADSLVPGVAYVYRLSGWTSDRRPLFAVLSEPVTAAAGGIVRVNMP